MYFVLCQNVKKGVHACHKHRGYLISANCQLYSLGLILLKNIWVIPIGQDSSSSPT